MDSSLNSEPCAQEETWHALVANAEFFFNDAQNEALAEQLREKRRFYREQVRDRSAWQGGGMGRWQSGATAGNGFQ